MTDPDEPAKRLYDALRTAGMTPQAWGEWEQLAATSPAALARLRHAARLLWPDAEQGVAPVEEPHEATPTLGEMAERIRTTTDSGEAVLLSRRLTQALAQRLREKWTPTAAEEPAVTEHRHMWDCAACRHDTIVLFCRHCPAIRQERL